MTRRTKMRVSLAGCGSIGRRHLANLRKLTAHCPAEIFIYDVSPSTSRAVSQEFDAIAVQHLSDLWDVCPDVALICTPSHLHTSCALAAAQAGAALIIEKPVAHTLEGLEDVAALAASQELISLVGCNMRFHPGPAQIQRWLTQGIIGDIQSARFHTGSYLPTWRPQQEYRESYSASCEHGGAILDCIHEIDLALWLLGPAWLHAALVSPAVTLGLQTDGLAELLLAHTSGPISSLHLNFIQRNYARRIEIIGSMGTLAWDYQSGEAVHYGTDGKRAEAHRQQADWQPNKMYEAELAYFLSCLQCGMQTFNPISSAIETLRLALQARRKGSGIPA